MNGFIPFLKFFWEYNWIAGFAVAFGLYLVLSRLIPEPGATAPLELALAPAPAPALAPVSS